MGLFEASHDPRRVGGILIEWSVVVQNRLLG
jgi:hypothetical protein